jgi:hypothetical protein
LISLFSRFQGLVDQIFFSVADREGGEGEQVVGGVAEHGSTLGSYRPGMPAMTSSCSRT